MDPVRAPSPHRVRAHDLVVDLTAGPHLARGWHLGRHRRRHHRDRHRRIQAPWSENGLLRERAHHRADRSARAGVPSRAPLSRAGAVGCPLLIAGPLVGRLGGRGAQIGTRRLVKHVRSRFSAQCAACAGCLRDPACFAQSALKTRPGTHPSRPDESRHQAQPLSGSPSSTSTTSPSVAGSSVVS